jgi:hypothetical protein
LLDGVAHSFLPPANGLATYAADAAIQAAMDYLDIDAELENDLDDIMSAWLTCVRFE